MKVICLIPRFNECGPTNDVLQLASNMKEMYNTTPMVVALQEATRHDLRENFHKLGVKTEIFGNKLFSKLKQLLAREQPDIVHSSGLIPDCLLAMARPRSLPIVTTIKADIRKELIYSHGYLRGVIESFIWIRALKKFSRIVPNSKGLEYNLKKDLGLYKNAHTIENYVDLEYDYDEFMRIRKESRKEYNLKEDDLVIVQVADEESHKRKGLHILNESLTRLKEKHPDIKAIQVGINNKEFINSYDNKDIRFLGFRRPLYKYLLIGDIFCLPSSTEGFPRAMLEAAGCGMPIIGTRIPGLVDFIEHNKTGLLMEERNADSLEKAILTLHKDRTLMAELGKNARKKFLENFTPERGMVEYMNLYKMLVEEYKKR